MSELIIIGETRRPGRFKCRVCHDRHDTTGQMRRCAERHHVEQMPERAKLAFLKPWDPEYAEWLKVAYRQGKVKPDPNPVS